jgi:PAS domain S-box-containing protein
MSTEYGSTGVDNAEHLRLFVAQAPVAMAMFGRDMRYIAASRRWNADYGFGEACLAGRSCYEMYPDMPELWKELHRRGLSGETLQGERDPFTPRDGPVQWLRWKIWPWLDAGGSVGGIFVSTENVTMQVETERALCESREDLKRAQAVARVGCWRFDASSSEITCSAETFRMLGWPPNRSLTFETLLNSVHPDDRERVIHHWSAAFSDTSYGIDYRVVAGNDMKWVRSRAEREFDAEGKIKGAFGTVQDITDKKQAESALRESEERLRSIVGMAPDGIIVIDEEGLIQSINPAGERMFGYASDELIGRSVSMLMAEPDRVHHQAYIDRYCRTHVSHIIGTSRDLEHQRKDGSIFPAALTLSEWQSGGKRYFTGIIRDISERRRREEQVKLLIRELNHRSKNMLTLVQAVARQTFAAKPDDFVARFGERIEALAASQDLLVKNEWKGLPLDELVRSQLAHFTDLIPGRIELKGPPLVISAAAAQTMGMALHELTTNAGKYGALSAGAGHVEIAWRLIRGPEGDERFELSWTEAGGPEVAPPKQPGFGTVIMDNIPSTNFDGEITLNYAKEGLRWRLVCPAKSVLDIASSGAG